MSEVSAVLLLVAVWGCGGGGSGSKEIDTGLPEATQLKDVSATQAASACENLQDSVESRMTALLTERRLCEMIGAFSSTTAAECEQVADTCVQQNLAADAQGSFDVSEGLDCDSGAANFAGCDVTVGEYEDCLSAQLSQVETLFKSFTCAKAGTFTDFDAEDMLATPDSVPACERLTAECPAASPFEAE
jgi:hypothetical protein